VVPWGDLSVAQGQLAAALQAPAGLRPPGPGPSPQPDPQLSLVLLHHQLPVGWLLVDQTGPDAVRYSSWFVLPAHRGQARALALLQEGFRRQRRAGRTIARAAFDGSNDAMRRFLRRRLGAHLDSIGEMRTSRWRRLTRG
jgi:ribosomal protein S18 acetylase RimI-like enzyme